VHTWLQLRLLADAAGETPPQGIRQLAEVTGKSASTLYGHLSLLRSHGLLRWRAAGKGLLIVSFDAESAPTPSPADPPPVSARDSGIREAGIGASLKLNPESIHKDKREEAALQDSGKSQTADLSEADAIAIYRAATGRRPNAAQRAGLLQRVHDLERWRRTLEHWLVHGWNPLNLAGLLDLYQRGGPEACRYCSKPQPAATSEALDELIAELRQGAGEERPHGRPRRDRRDP
jgi:DNA-binding transcriptional ArsR family regulator